MNNSGFLGGVTALMSTYINSNPDLLKRAIASIYANSVIPDEVIVICDGPLNANSTEILDGFKEKYSNFKCHWLPRNIGLTQALNFGLQHISTTWVARCDDDDFNCSDRFEKQRNYLLQHPQVQLLGSNISEVDLNGRFISQRRVPEDITEIRKVTKLRNPFNHMTVIYDCHLALKVGGYPVMAYQDYGLWIKMLGSGCIAANIQESLVHATTGDGLYLRRGGSQIAKDEFKLAHLLYQYQFKSYLPSIITAVLRAMAALMPPKCKHLLYRYLLRK
jgi:glycosyltransferase involved in cell wall biosynthesis